MVSGGSATELDRMAATARARADENGTPYLVCWDKAGAHIVAAPEYTAETCGAVERVRYPRGYAHPPLVSKRKW